MKNWTFLSEPDHRLHPSEARVIQGRWDTGSTDVSPSLHTLQRPCASRGAVRLGLRQSRGRAGGRQVVHNGLTGARCKLATDRSRLSFKRIGVKPAKWLSPLW